MKILKVIVLAVFMVPAVAACDIDIADIQVDNGWFSPNGDGILDTTFVNFNLSTDLGWAAVWIWVTDGEGATVRTLASDEAVLPGTIRKAWDGRDSGGQRAAEGGYVFRMFARAGGDTTETYAAGAVLDVTAPSFSAILDPNPYTPDLPMADSVLSVEVSFDACQPDDRLCVALTVDDRPETLCTRHLDLGNTTYVCIWDGRESDDGVYPLMVWAYDRAGNTARASYAVDLDNRSPSLGITAPAKATLNAVPERAEGYAFDRSGLDSVGFRFKADSEYGRVQTDSPGDTLYWYVPWPDDLHADGSYSLQIFARDIYGHTASVTHDVTIDTQAPATPVFSSLPATVSHPRLDIQGSCPGRDSLVIYLNSESYKRLVCQTGGTFSAEVILEEGLNKIYARARDKAGNVSAPSETLMVAYVKSVGITVPERLTSDSMIDITLPKAADLITVRIFTLEGAFVATLTEPSPEIVGGMTWNLEDTEGHQVRNGVYVMVFEVRYSDGDDEVQRKAVMVVR
jgi:flagellar hook assembly protein FlgD